MNVEFQLYEVKRSRNRSKSRFDGKRRFRSTSRNKKFDKKDEKTCFYHRKLTFSCPCHTPALAAHVACTKIPEYCKVIYSSFKMLKLYIFPATEGVTIVNVHTTL